MPSPWRHRHRWRLEPKARRCVCDWCRSDLKGGAAADSIPFPAEDRRRSWPAGATHVPAGPGRWWRSFGAQPDRSAVEAAGALEVVSSFFRSLAVSSTDE